MDGPSIKQKNMNTNEKIAGFLNRFKSKKQEVENIYKPKLSQPMRTRTIMPETVSTFNEVFQNTVKHKYK